jgi:ABC-type Na+ efflux pump permease subunit
LAAVRAIEPQLGKDTPRFSITGSGFFEASLPASLSYASSGAEFDAAAEAMLGPDIDTARGKRPLGLAAYFPKDGGPAQIWMNDNSRGLYWSLRDVVLREQRIAAARAQGLSDEQIEAKDPLSFDSQFRQQPPATRVSAATLRRGVGLALCYLTYIVVTMTGGLLLQSTMEEKSGRLMESLLAIAKPSEILGGKLAAMAGVALLLALVWSGTALTILSILPAAIRQPAYEMLSSVASPLGVVRLLFYFITGYLIMAMPFLTIGALCETAQDAQPFTLPLICLFLPLVYIMAGAITTPDSALLHWLSWVPFYTPFAMTARLGDPVPLWQIGATALLLIGFVILEYRFMGQVFRAFLLQGGQSAKWREVLRQGWAGILRPAD